MAIQSASATLTADFTLLPITGFIPFSQGDIDAVSGAVKAQGTSSWRQLSGQSWSDFTNYIQSYASIRWTAPIIDLGAVQYFTLNIESEFSGSIYYIIYVSTTGEFTGEETEYCAVEGDYSVPGFYGQYVYVTAVVNGTELRRMTVTADTTVREYLITDVDSSTLSGSSSNRIIDLPAPVSLIKDIRIQAKAATSYAVNLYVSDTATSEVLIPVVKSKSGTSPSFALYGIDNDPRDGIVDIKISALPRQAMFAGNLVVLA